MLFSRARILTDVLPCVSWDAMIQNYVRRNTELEFAIWVPVQCPQTWVHEAPKIIGRLFSYMRFFPGRVHTFHHVFFHSGPWSQKMLRTH